MGSREWIAVFLSDFDLQVKEIEQVYERLEKKRSLLQGSSPTSEVVESAGYWLHNLYNALEDLFQLVARFWENSLADSGLYHRSFLLISPTTDWEIVNVFYPPFLFQGGDRGVVVWSDIRRENAP
jgi:hypothetical protein